MATNPWRMNTKGMKEKQYSIKMRSDEAWDYQYALKKMMKGEELTEEEDNRLNDLKNRIAFIASMKGWSRVVANK